MEVDENRYHDITLRPAITLSSLSLSSSYLSSSSLSPFPPPSPSIIFAKLLLYTFTMYVYFCVRGAEIFLTVMVDVCNGIGEGGRGRRRGWVEGEARYNCK